MVELRWWGRRLQYRQRQFQVDASGAFCGLTDFGPWQTVPDEMLNGVRKVNVAVEQHGGPYPHYPELHEAIAKLDEDT